MLRAISLTSVFCFVVAFALNPRHTVQAAEVQEPQSVPFTPEVVDPLQVAASGGADCPAVASDTARYRFVLPVTEELTAQIAAGIGAGYTPAIALGTVASFVATGNGKAGYSAEIKVFIEHTDGSSSLLDVLPDYEVASSSYELKNVIVTSLVDQVMPGDNIAIEATAQGVANAGGCESSDRAGVWWEVSGIDGDPDRPVITGLVSPAH